MQAQELKNQSELDQSLSKDLQEQEESTQTWLKDQHLKIELLREETRLQDRIKGAQVRDKDSTFTKYILKENSLTFIADMVCLF